MAGFASSSSSSFQQLPSYYSSSSPPTINNKSMCVVGPFEEPTSSQFFQFGHRMNLDHHQISTKVSDLRVIINNELNNFLGVTANKKNSTNTTVDSSSIVTADNNINYSTGNAVQHFTQTLKDDTLMDKKRKSNEGSSSNSAQSKDMRAMKKEKQQKKKVKCNGELENKKKSKELKTADGATNGYIHVRARRGQATDSHSLAERVRREKISERMKLLQALVPGCEKVTGKALMLDEIINYVQSLQNQVEFLSMKLASINPIFYDFGMDLESFMARPDQDLNSLPSTLQGMQQLSPTLTANHYPIFMDNTANSLLLHHAHISNALPQDRRQVLWEVDEQGYNNKIMNQQSGVSNSGLFSFN